MLTSVLILGACASNPLMEKLSDDMDIEQAREISHSLDYNEKTIAEFKGYTLTQFDNPTSRAVYVITDSNNRIVSLQEYKYGENYGESYLKDFVWNYNRLIEDVRPESRQ
jgi:hypothetical protein